MHAFSTLNISLYTEKGSPLALEQFLFGGCRSGVLDALQLEGKREERERGREREKERKREKSRATRVFQLSRRHCSLYFEQSETRKKGLYRLWRYCDDNGVQRTTC
jgi:hypothetical protein